MWPRQLVFGLMWLILTATSSLAQTTNGAQQFNRDLLTAFAATGSSFILVAADRSEMPFGSSGYAVINTFDFSTGQFSQCSSANFDLTVNGGRVALSFVVEAAFNCSIGQTITVSCEPTSNSGLFHYVINGTVTLNEQHFTTHGENRAYNNLTCILNAFGVESVAQGGAGTERTRATP